MINAYLAHNKLDSHNPTIRFIAKYSFKERCDHFEQIKLKYPDRIPIIIEKSEKCKELEALQHSSLLVHKNTPMVDIIRTIKNNLKLEPTKSIYIMVGNYAPMLGESVESIYNRHKAPDGFLYIVYLTQNTFG